MYIIMLSKHCLLVYPHPPHICTLTTIHHKDSSVEFSTCVIPTFQKFWVSDFLFMIVQPEI